MLDELHSFLDAAGSPRICVIGDMMLDIYVWGDVSRISQEGPIPVLRVQRRERRTGGAGNVAAMLSALGARASAVGLVGSDPAADALRDQLTAAGVDVSGLVASPGRPTATKTRYLGYVQSAGRALQQIVRVDEEVTDPLSDRETALVRGAAWKAVEEAELVVLQDMGKGLLGPDLIADLIARARELGKAVIVDPELTDDYAPYAGATCVLPNRSEAQVATGLPLAAEGDYPRAAHALLDRLALEAAVIKLDRDGIYFAASDGSEGRTATVAREVADITGAGDMVTAAFAFARAAGADYAAAVELANFTAGLEVASHGVTPLPRAQVLAALRAESDPTARKIVPRDQVGGLRERLRDEGKRVVFTNGCFDLLHLGHVHLLRFARAQGDALMVGLNSDVSVLKLKGPGRPINSEVMRGRVLASLADVDYVVLFDERDVLRLVEQVAPDVLVKGADYAPEDVLGKEFVESYGGRVKLAPLAKGYSTTDIIKRIAENHERTDRSGPA